MAKIAFLTGGTNETTLDGISRAVTRNYTSPGCIGDNDLQVTQNGTPDNKVLVGVGSALIGFNSPAGTQEDKYYHLFADVAETVTITANTSGNPRIDAIVAYPDTSGGAPTDNDGAGMFAAIAGTPAATPSAPTDANIVTALGAGVPYIVLAHVAVANGFTSIVNANITDMRIFADTNDRVIGDTASDFVASGLLWSASAGLVGAMTSGRAYIGGKHINKSALTHTFTASKDTYVDAASTVKHSNYDDLTYTEVANGAASPALAAGSIRLAKVVTSGAAITSVTTTGWDSLGNPIRNTGNISTNKYADASVTYNKISKFDKASATRTSTQLIGNSSSTACSFTAAAFQRVAGDMWVVGDPTKITIRTTGIYLIAGNVAFTTNSTGIRSAAILLNGSSLNPLAETQITAASASTTNLSVVTILSLTAGNYITMNVYQDSGGNLNVNNSRLSVSLLV